MKNEKNAKQNRQKEAFMKSLSQGTSILKACKAANISVVTIWRWRNDSKEFDDKVLAILDSRTQTVEDALFKSVLAGNIAAIIFYLKNRASARWKDKQEQIVEGDLKVTIVSAVPRPKK